MRIAKIMDIKFLLTKIEFTVGVGVPDDPSEKYDLDGHIFPHTELPPYGGWDVEDAIPYGHISILLHGPPHTFWRRRRIPGPAPGWDL